MEARYVLTVIGLWQTQHPFATQEELIGRTKYTGDYMMRHWFEISSHNMNAYEINAGIDAELELTRKANTIPTEENKGDKKTENDNEADRIIEYADKVDDYICELCKNDEILRKFMAMFSMLLLQARGTLIDDLSPEKRAQKAEQMAEIRYEVALLTARIGRTT